MCRPSLPRPASDVANAPRVPVRDAAVPHGRIRGSLRLRRHELRHDRGADQHASHRSSRRRGDDVGRAESRALDVPAVAVHRARHRAVRRAQSDDLGRRSARHVRGRQPVRPSTHALLARAGHARPRLESAVRRRHDSALAQRRSRESSPRAGAERFRGVRLAGVRVAARGPRGAADRLAGAESRHAAAAGSDDLHCDSAYGPTPQPATVVRTVPSESRS